MIHDPALSDEPALLAAATAALQLALDNERLTATVSAQTGARRQPAVRSRDVAATPTSRDPPASSPASATPTLTCSPRNEVSSAASVRTWHGREIDARADEFFAVFPSATDAAAAALAITRRIRTQSWPRDVEVRIRIGLHTGEPGRSTDGYVGLDVHRAARIGNAGHGGQIVVSAATEAAIRGALPADARLSSLGRVQLRGLPDPDNLFQLSAPDLPSTFPALRTGVDVQPS